MKPYEYFYEQFRAETNSYEYSYSFFYSCRSYQFIYWAAATLVWQLRTLNSAYNLATISNTFEFKIASVSLKRASLYAEIV
eukprot:scaffold306856_cov19-Prasinocladus_malaysianus.AAC.1